LISFRYYLDTRKAPRKRDGRHPLKLVVSKRGAAAMMPTVVHLAPQEWDADAQRVTRAHPQRAAINNYLDQLRMKVEDQIRALVLSGEAAPLSAYQIRDLLAGRILDAGPGISLAEYYRKVQEEKTPQTARHFENAWRAFVKIDKRVATMPLSALNADLVRRLDRGLRGLVAINSRNNYIAKLTQVAKRAHREGLVQEDAGREIHLQYVIPKSRALDAEQLRQFFALEPATERAREALDLFKLSFYLRGMNGVDISEAGPGDIFNGRLLYDRRKTGRPYSVKIEPETEALIAARGDRAHLFAPMAKYADYSRYIQDVNEKLRNLAKGAGLPPVTMYWARHTFASLVIETGGTMEILAGALGHSYGPRVTAGYVTLQQRQVDEAVRRVFDYIK
jgi:hypothetical protein